MRKGFTFLDIKAPGVRWDCRYATWNNITGKPLEGYETNRIVVSEALGNRLLAVKKLAEDLGCGLFVWDAYRPQRSVDALVDWALEEPAEEPAKLQFYPNLDRTELLTEEYLKRRSSHSRGGAVDLTLYSLATGELLPMGTDFECFDERSHHGASGLTAEEAENRQLLLYLMEQSEFLPYEKEWWHYQMKDEPYPNRYFNFPIR